MNIATSNMTRYTRRNAATITSPLWVCSALDMGDGSLETEYRRRHTETWAQVYLHY